MKAHLLKQFQDWDLSNSELIICFDQLSFSYLYVETIINAQDRSNWKYEWKWEKIVMANRSL